MPAPTEYRSGRGVAVGGFSPPRTTQGIPLKPVPMSGQTGAPQTAIWSVADAIMSQTMGDEIDAEDPEAYDDDGIHDEPRIADWDVWNTPRYDLQRFHQREGYVTDVELMSEELLRSYVRMYLEAMAAGGGTLGSGNIRGVVTPLGTGPTHPKPSDRRGARKRTRKRLKVAADSFGGGTVK